MPNATQPASGSFVRNDLHYVLPMAVFLGFTWAGGQWPAFFVSSYVLKTFLAAAVIIYFWRCYTPIRWTHAGLGVLVGIVGIVQWVGMELVLLKIWPNYPRPHPELFDPYAYFQSPLSLWSFTIIRWAGAALMVPFMEELFWRDYLWRTVQAPNDFHLAEVGEPDWKALLFVAALFASVHVQWMTAFVWGLMIGGLLIYTRSLGACIIAHGVTNFLLGAYVQYTKDWFFW
ncbi:MAG: CAAX prenyl protease-related protein [Planctomycetota bacterium]|nr:CAAX prenyl protease-related protein [Planctomycetota bacterium]